LHESATSGRRRNPVAVRALRTRLGTRRARAAEASTRPYPSFRASRSFQSCYWASTVSFRPIALVRASNVDCLRCSPPHKSKNAYSARRRVVNAATRSTNRQKRLLPEPAHVLANFNLRSVTYELGTHNGTLSCWLPDFAGVFANHRVPFFAAEGFREGIQV